MHRHANYSARCCLPGRRTAWIAVRSPQRPRPEDCGSADRAYSATVSLPAGFALASVRADLGLAGSVSVALLAAGRRAAVALNTSSANLRWSARSCPRKSNAEDMTASGSGRDESPGSLSANGHVGSLPSKGATGILAWAADMVSTTFLIASRVISWLLRTAPSTCSCMCSVVVAVIGYLLGKFLCC